MRKDLQEHIRTALEPLTKRDQAKQEREEQQADEIGKAKEAADKSDPAQA